MSENNQTPPVASLEPVLGEVQKNWKWLLVLGIAFIVLGFIGLGRAFALTVATVYFFGFLLLIAAVLLARLVRHWHERSAGKIQIRYLDGTVVPIEPGMTVLDGSRLANIPHASVCGGRGRCSTCRVRPGTGAKSATRSLDAIGLTPRSTVGTVTVQASADDAVATSSELPSARPN